MTINASLGPSDGTASTPQTAGAAAAPSVFTPSARPKPAPRARASSLRWLNSAPIASVAGPKAAIASAASAAIAAKMPLPSARSAKAFTVSAAHSDAAPSRQAAPSAPSSRSVERGIGASARPPALVTGGAGGAADQIDREQQREGVDGVLGDLAEHAHDQDLEADAEKAGERQARQHRRGVLGGRAARRSALAPDVRSRNAISAVTPAGQVQRDADPGGAPEPDRRDQPERRGEHAGDRAKGVAGVERGDRIALAVRARGQPFHRRQRRAHRRGRRKKEQERAEERHRPLPRRRRLHADDPQRPALNAGISASSSRLQSPIASSHAAYQRAGRALRAMRDPSAKRARRQPAEERGHHRQHRRRLVAQPERALLRPDDLVAEPGEAGGRHQDQRQDLRRATATHGGSSDQLSRIT